MLYEVITLPCWTACGRCYYAVPLRNRRRPMDYRQPKPRKSQHARIVHELGRLIVSGRLKPEEKLPAEAQLCEDYDVSRTVLREATRVLVAKGLVQSKPRVGSVVRPRRDWHSYNFV